MKKNLNTWNLAMTCDSWTLGQAQDTRQPYYALTYLSRESTDIQLTVPKCCRNSLPVVVEGAINFVVGSGRDQGYHHVVVFS